MVDMGSPVGPLLPRASSGTDAFLSLIQNPFTSNNFLQNSVWAGLSTSIGFTLLLAALFSFLRPFNSVVYSPKLRHADPKHAPPPMGKGTLAWFTPVVRTKEQDLIHFVGLDATIFLRFARMCRNMFLSLAVVGCGILIPINLTMGAVSTNLVASFTPIVTFGQANWGQVVCAYLFNIIVAGFLYFNYRKVLELRRQYFNSDEYQNSLHARTLMINDIPKNYRTDEGIGRLIDEVVPSSSFSRTAIARNVKELPELIAEHDKTVRQLEKYLAEYLQNPDNLPKSRPMCKPSKEDPSWGSYPRGQKVDAIEYLTGRIKDLETEVKEIRLTVDKRNAMPYGFASYDGIPEAHSIAFAARKKHPQGTTIVLAPKPNDVIWKNMPLSKSTRKSKALWTNLWITLLTILWIVPNAMISIFLVNLQNLGQVWPAFNGSLGNHPTWWALVQGVASPALTSLTYLVLPIIFRRMSIRGGDRTKTARERHVTSRLYTFFVFNNLIVFSVFNVAAKIIATVISSTQQGTGTWDAIQNIHVGDYLLISLCTSSPFWITYLLQRNLGAAVDLAQLWPLVWKFCIRKFSSPTPRELIELSAPPAFDYASYYNYFLFYCTVALAFATIQPLVLPAAALYFAVDVYLKKYLLLYIFITKTESGGMFWRVLFNRLVFAAILGNLMVFLCVFGTNHGDATNYQAFSVVPLPFLMIGFKIFCARTFDDKILYATTGMTDRDPEFEAKSRSNRSDKLASRYGHPALYRRLITPMVHARAQNILASIYLGRLTDSNNPDSADITSVSGYSDTYAMDVMKSGEPGRSVTIKAKKQTVPGFEVVPESHLDFSFYKNRAEFTDEHGGGQMYSPSEITRSGTPGTILEEYDTPGSTRPGTPTLGNTTPGGPRRVATGLSASESAYDTQGDIGTTRFNDQGGYSEQQGLVAAAAEPPLSTPLLHAREDSPDRRAVGFLGGESPGYRSPGQPEEEPLNPSQDTTSYDYFRAKRQPGGWQG